MEGTKDEHDGLTWRKPQATPGQSPYDDVYKTHPNRGIALIFNHQYFENPYLKERQGTQLDGDALERALKGLKFHVEVYNDLGRREIFDKLEVVSKMDHSNNDCLVVAAMSHGDSNGKIFAKDKEYNVDDLVHYFTGKKCPQLAGKPKLFFIQACRGEKYDSGVAIMTQTDSASIGSQSIIYTIPIMADILIMNATTEGFFAWRDTQKGSWFMQALAEQLEKNGKERDLLSILTLVNRDVAIGSQSSSSDPDFDQKKEMCSILSTLTRLLYFK